MGWKTHIKPEDIEPPEDSPLSPLQNACLEKNMSQPEATLRFIALLVRRALDKSNGNQHVAAIRLKIKRTTLVMIIRRLKREKLF
jgi:transcriptional regulator with GAF, ATPase, and Fis domain